MNSISIDPSKPRELTYDERATWGTCPICEAPPGEWCRAEVGLHLGVKCDGTKLHRGEGAHFARIQAAPTAVRIVPV